MFMSLSSPVARRRYQSCSWPFHLSTPSASQLLGEIVRQPLRAFGDQLDQMRRDSGLLPRTRAARSSGLLALVDPALRHSARPHRCYRCVARQTPGRRRYHKMVVGHLLSVIRLAGIRGKVVDRSSVNRRFIGRAVHQRFQIFDTPSEIQDVSRWHRLADGEEPWTVPLGCPIDGLDTGIHAATA